MSFCGICTVQRLKAFSTMKPIQVPATETEHHLTGAMSHDQLIPSNVDNYTLSQPRRDSNPQSSDSKSDALSIRPRGPYDSNVFLPERYWPIMSIEHYGSVLAGRIS